MKKHIVGMKLFLNMKSVLLSCRTKVTETKFFPNSVPPQWAVPAIQQKYTKKIKWKWKQKIELLNQTLLQKLVDTENKVMHEKRVSFTSENARLFTDCSAVVHMRIFAPKNILSNFLFVFNSDILGKETVSRNYATVFLTALPRSYKKRYGTNSKYGI